MIKLVLTGLWVCAVTLASVYFSVQTATAPAVSPDDAKKAQQELVKGESINVPVIANGQVTGYFLTRISFMMEKGKANALQIPLPELTTDELFSLLIGNKAIDIAHTQSFDVAAFRSDLKKRMNERLGGDYVADVLIQQLDYLSKEETHGGETVGKKTVKPVKIVQEDVYKRQEKIFINGAVLRVDRKVALEFLNDVTFLLENHVLQPEEAKTPLRQLYFIAQMILINPEGKEQSTAMFRKSIVMLLSCFHNEEVLAELKRIDGLVATGRAFDALKAIRGLYPVEDNILNNQEMPAATIEHIRREIAPWQR